jgi:hypothetical protein
MAKYRNAATDRMWDDYRKERSVWNSFQSRMQTITTVGELAALVEESPPAGSSGHEFYSRLASFLWHKFEVPEDAGGPERELYSGLLRRLYEHGQLSDETAQRLNIK